jgi:catechol 2,3-dioxygenase-like lactoylglutathione lyase family enzyme
MKLNQITVRVIDLDRSIRFYSLLGLELIVKDDHYARFVVPGNQATFSLELSREPMPSSTVIYFECEDLDRLVNELQRRGLVFLENPTDQQWLWREAYLLDPDAHQICLYYAGENRLNPPWKIQ